MHWLCTFVRLDPDNQRSVDAYHMPNPDSITPDGEYDIRTARLPVWHADRRPIVYFSIFQTVFTVLNVSILFYRFIFVVVTAGVTAGGAAFVRGWISSMVYTWWPAKDVFSAGVVRKIY